MLDFITKFLKFVFTKSEKCRHTGFYRVDPGAQGGGRRRGKPLLTGRYMLLNHRSPYGLVGF